MHLEFADIKPELLRMGIVYLVLLAILKTVFFKEPFIQLAAVAFGIVYAFVIPGYALMLRISKKPDFLASLIIGTVLSIAIIGISSYYIGLFGLHVKYHFFLPALFTALFLLLPSQQKMQQ